MEQAKTFSFFKTSRKRQIAGSILGLLALFVCGLWISWPTGGAFALLFLLGGFVKIATPHPVMDFAPNVLWGVGCIFLSAMAPALIYNDSIFFQLDLFRILMNFVCVAAVYGICLVLIGRVKPAVVLASGIFLVISSINFFVFQFRGHELKASDFLYVSTAINVMGQYKFVIPASMAFCWIAWLWSVFALGSLPDWKIRPMWVRTGALVATTLCAAVLQYGTRNMKSNGWENQGTQYNGYYLNLFMGIRECAPVKPQDYTPEAVQEIAASYPPVPGIPEKRPNIVVILSESYGDLSVLGSPLKTNRPVTPFIDSLQENTIRGYALTSIFGGTTANAEFELLTGGSMAFQPSHTVPYVQHIRGNLYSLAWLLGSYGYTSGTTHPFLASGYDRPRVYPYLGFSESTFDEAYPNARKVRQFISDEAAYDYILNQLDRPEPQFLYTITMQNHSGYSYEGENYEKTISLEGYEGTYPNAEQYLSLLNETDRATEKFLTALKDASEDTIVLFYGDHLPDLEWEFYEELHGGPFESLSDQMLRYTVPFFLWANFDIEEEEVPCTSLNYLSTYLLKAAGMELPPYHQFLADMEETIPAINAHGYYSRSRQTFLPLEEADGPEAEALRQYALVQFNNMSDSKNRDETFFETYLP